MRSQKPHGFKFQRVQEDCRAAAGIKSIASHSLARTHTLTQPPTVAQRACQSTSKPAAKMSAYWLANDNNTVAAPSSFEL